MAIPKVIILKSRTEQCKIEALADGAIMPGHLLYRKALADLAVHVTAGGNAQPIFALESECTRGTIDTAYLDNSQVLAMLMLPGDHVYALVAASCAAIAYGDPLESAGDGTLRKHTGPTQAVNEAGSATYTIAPATRAIVGYCMGAVNNSANGASTARIEVEIA